MGYFEDVHWQDIIDNYGGPAYVDKHQMKNVGCFACPIRCKNFLHVPEIGKGFTTCEPWSGFTGSVWNLDMDIFWKAIRLTNRMGLDSTETSACIGLLMELQHEGIISEKDTDGILMERGSETAIIETVRKLSMREGFGDLMAEGQKAFAEKIGPAAVDKLNNDGIGDQHQGLDHGSLDWRTVLDRLDIDRIRKIIIEVCSAEYLDTSRRALGLYLEKR